MSDYENEKLEKKIDELSSRLDQMERKVGQTDHASYKEGLGRNIWVLVPVVAIIMWGLKSIFA